MPEWQSELRSRLATLRLNPAREAEIIEELSQDLQERYDALRRSGVSDADAHRLVVEELLEPDALARHMQPLRQAHVPPPITPGTPSRAFLSDAWQDLRYAARMLRKQPGFTTAVVLTLALGIGANTAIFTLVNATLFQRLPVPDRERVVYVNRGDGEVFSYPAYAWLRDGSKGFDGLAAWGGIVASLNAGNAAELVTGAIVTGNFFDVLGIRAERGRLISVADDRTPGAHPVAVISHEFWQSRFAGQPDVIGRQVRLNGQVFTIIGITPAGFPGAQLETMRHLYVPMMMQAVMRPPRAGYSGERNPDLLKNPSNSWLSGVGRLRPGVALEQASAELDALATSFIRSQLARDPGRGPAVAVVQVDAADPALRQQQISVALLLGGVVGAVLLIGCANVANLLLARATSRRRELAVRLAIGASRTRIVRQLLAESLLLSLLGGATGVAVAWATVRGFEAAPPPAGGFPAVDLAIDRRVLLFSLTLSLLTGIVFGLAPALKASRPTVVPALKDAAADEGTRGRFSLKQALVVAEVALSLLLLIAAGLFVRSLQSAQAIDPRFDSDKLVSAPLNINLLRYTTAQGREFYRRVVERMEQLPGVESASLARVAALSSGGRVVSLHVQGREASHDQVQSEGAGDVRRNRTAINANVVGPAYFRTLGVPVLIGRAFTDQDAQGRPLVTAINETAAAMHFNGENPIGRRVSFGGAEGPWREIVGVVRDSTYFALGEATRPMAYVPLAQNHETGMTLYVRASIDPASLIPAIRSQIQSVEPDLPLPNVQTLSDTINRSLYAARMGAWLLGVFGGLAMLLAAVGIYGVLSFSTSRRTHEIGVRMALGADTRNVFLLIVRDGMLLVALGIVLGVAGGLAGGRSIASFLYGVAPSDAPTFAVTVLLLATVALAACAIPAARAMRVSPIVALRRE
jgi:macrolide transport system ATP-binding/permease protein